MDQIQRTRKRPLVPRNDDRRWQQNLSADILFPFANAQTSNQIDPADDYNQNQGQNAFAAPFIPQYATSRQGNELDLALDRAASLRDLADLREFGVFDLSLPTSTCLQEFSHMSDIESILLPPPSIPQPALPFDLFPLGDAGSSLVGSTEQSSLSTRSLSSPSLFLPSDSDPYPISQIDNVFSSAISPTWPSISPSASQSLPLLDLDPEFPEFVKPLEVPNCIEQGQVLGDLSLSLDTLLADDSLVFDQNPVSRAIEADTFPLPNFDPSMHPNTSSSNEARFNNIATNLNNPLSDKAGVDANNNGFSKNFAELLESDIFNFDADISLPDVFGKQKIAPAPQRPAIHPPQPHTKPQPKADLKIIYENGITSAKAPQTRVRRGIRRARLTEERSAAIRSKRNTHEVCIKCKTARSECVGGMPCQRCVTAWLKKPNIPKQPCLKAHFLDTIESGSCNYVSHRITSHLTLDGKKRITMEIPDSFDLTSLLKSVQSREFSFNIRRRKMDQTLFVIDMAETVKMLKSVSDSSTHGGVSTFREFIDSTLLKSFDWKHSVTECDIDNPMSLLETWNNEPCRASYDVVPLDGSHPRPLDVSNPDDVQEIILAATLSRMICRKVEIEGYRAMQKAINKLRFENSENAVCFVKEMGNVLLTLRWRLSWWEVYGDGRNDTDPQRLLYVDRVKQLTMVLYFYFFTAKKCIGSWFDPSDMGGVWNEYADTLPMWDNYPTVESLNGMETWLEDGKALVKAAADKKVPIMKL